MLTARNVRCYQQSVMQHAGMFHWWCPPLDYARQEHSLGLLLGTEDPVVMLNNVDFSLPFYFCMTGHTNLTLMN